MFAGTKMLVWSEKITDFRFYDIIQKYIHILKSINRNIYINISKLTFRLRFRLLELSLNNIYLDKFVMYKTKFEMELKSNYGTKTFVTLFYCFINSRFGLPHVQDELDFITDCYFDSTTSTKINFDNIINQHK